jgi:LEA14-like dessication related protein
MYRFSRTPWASVATQVCIILATLLITGCASLTQGWQAPEVQLTSLRPEKISLDEQQLRVGLDITNPNDRTLPIKAMTYQLSLEGTQVAEGGGKLDRQIPALGTESVEVSVLADAGAALGMLPMLALRRDPIEYRLSGTVTVAGVVPIPYRYSGELDPAELLRAAGRR